MKKPFALLAILAVSGCRMCSDCGDYSPPVAGSPYDGVNHRAGSAFNGEVYPTTPPTPRESTNAKVPEPFKGPTAASAAAR